MRVTNRETGWRVWPWERIADHTFSSSSRFPLDGRPIIIYCMQYNNILSWHRVALCRAHWVNKLQYFILEK